MFVNFKEQVVGITGYSTSTWNFDYHLVIARLIELEGGNLDGDFGDTDVWGQLILVGDEDFNKDYLIQSIEDGIVNNSFCDYISLEDFWEYYTGEFEPYSEGDKRIENHAALSFLASLYEKYPEVDILNFGNNKKNEYRDWNIESLLKSEFGYSVRKGVSEEERRNSLKRALKSNMTNIKEVAEHIVFNINLRKGNPTMNLAVNKWLEDLHWMKRKFYDKSIHSFRFPQPNK